MTARVRAACLTNYVEVARQAGLDPWAQLRHVGLPRTCISNPDLKIPVVAVCELLERSAALSGQETFALRMAEGRRVSNLGIVGMLMREEPDLREALRSAVKYGRTHNEALFHRIEESGGIASIHEELLTGSAVPARQAIELAVAVALRVMRFFLAADWQPRRVCFTHEAPLDVSVHRRVLGRTPQFGSEFNGIVCASADLDTPIASADPVVAGIIRLEAQKLSHASLTVVDEVKQVVLLLLPRGRCTVDEVARLMGVHRRTLHRHLAAEGQVFSLLVQAVRCELASRYVQEPRRLTDIAQQLGFADLSSFSRWHKAAFGQAAVKQRSHLRRLRT